MGAPQIIYIGLLMVGLGVHIAKHGQQRDPYNAGEALLGSIIVIWLLWWGGFFA